MSKITNFGAFIRLNNGIEGLVHISELADKEVEKVEDVLRIGQVASFRVIKVSAEERKLGLSLRTQREASEQRADVEPKQPREERKPRKQAATSTEERAAQPRQQQARESAPAQTTTSSSSSMKSSLQQALEEHAARANKKQGQE